MIWPVMCGSGLLRSTRENYSAADKSVLNANPGGPCVLRGGSWTGGPRRLRGAARFGGAPRDGNERRGFSPGQDFPLIL